jgi:hypothetical protein
MVVIFFFLSGAGRQCVIGLACSLLNVGLSFSVLVGNQRDGLYSEKNHIDLNSHKTSNSIQWRNNSATQKISCTDGMSCVSVLVRLSKITCF